MKSADMVSSWSLCQDAGFGPICVRRLWSPDIAKVRDHRGLPEETVRLEQGCLDGGQRARRQAVERKIVGVIHHPIVVDLRELRSISIFNLTSPSSRTSTSRNTCTRCWEETPSQWPLYNLREPPTYRYLLRAGSFPLCDEQRIYLLLLMRN